MSSKSKKSDKKEKQEKVQWEEDDADELLSFSQQDLPPQPSKRKTKTKLALSVAGDDDAKEKDETERVDAEELKNYQNNCADLYCVAGTKSRTWWYCFCL